MTEQERVTELEIIKSELDLILARMDKLIQDWRDSLQPNKPKKYEPTEEKLFAPFKDFQM